jgi:acetate kinase
MVFLFVPDRDDSPGTIIIRSRNLTPAAGVPMSTRSGDLDSGLVWYLARTEKMSEKQFNEMVNFESTTDAPRLSR